MKKEYKVLQLFVGIMLIIYYLIGIIFANATNIHVVLHKNFYDSAYVILFMALGAVLLDSYEEGILAFYIRNILVFGIPFVLLSIIALIRKIGFSISLGFLKDFVIGFFTGTILGPLSLFYTIFVLILITPFMAKLVKACDNQHLKALMLLIILYFVFFDICVLLDYRIAIASYPFINMFGYALLGYGVVHYPFSKKHRYIIAGLCMVSVIISSIEVTKFNGVNWALDTYCLTRALISIGVFRAFYVASSKVNVKTYVTVLNCIATIAFLTLLLAGSIIGGN